MHFYVWARTDGAWKLIALTRELSDAEAVFDRYVQSYIADDNDVVKVKRN